MNGKLKKAIILLMVSATLFANGWLNVFSGDFLATSGIDDDLRIPCWDATNKNRVELKMSVLMEYTNTELKIDSMETRLVTDRDSIDWLSDYGIILSDSILWLYDRSIIFTDSIDYLDERSVIFTDSIDALGVLVSDNADSIDALGILVSSNADSVDVLALLVSANADSEVAQLALTTEEGDVVIRSDESKSYIKNSGTAGTMADFYELLTPTDNVLSVNTKTGTVVINPDDLSDTSTTNKFVTAGDITKLGNLSNTNSGDNATNSQYSGLVSNVTTNLSAGTLTATTIDVNSSDGVVKLPYLTSAPTSPENGMMWMESTGLHIYYNNGEKTVAGV